MSAVDSPPSPPATSSGSRKRLLPLSVSTSTPESSSLASKKVEFSPWADALPDSSGVRSLPPSRECQSYIKSILKPSLQDEKQSAGFDGPADDKLLLNEAMESIIQQLSKNDNTESIDAYQTLASTIKAYDEIPDQAVLKNKLTTITRQIRRHLGVKERPGNEPSDINIVTSALKVLVILVWNSELEALLSDDFRFFILDRSISVIAEHTAPKSVLVHYLHLLATQDFRHGLLTSNGRASRLIEALAGLTEHVKGNGVVSERLLVYQRLLDQARTVMKSRSSRWVEHMLSAMASNIADTRNKALALGRKACQAFPASSSISGSVRMALDMKQETGRTLGMSICRRLEKMVMGKDDAVQVPQIWAVILLLCNNSSMRIDAWPGLKEWLMVIQRCFNGSDSSLRLQANSAWNRFVYISRPHEASDSLVAMLSKPVAAQLDRSAHDKSSKALHAVAVSSYCNLLYYAFRPATTLSQYNRVWNEYIVKIMRSSLLEKNSGNADVASRILMTLFWDAKRTTKVWNENRAHENRLVEPEELPTIDCKWTRSRCSPILEIFQILFRHSSWGLPGSQDQAYVAKAWQHFLKAIREAGSKEIKMSHETRVATVSILKFLSKLWHADDATESYEHDGHPGHNPTVPISDAGEQMHLTKEALTYISFVAVTELGVERILERFANGDVVEFGPELTDAIKQLLPYQYVIEPRVEPPASSRKRHNDSQVRFVPIESSPPRAAAEDSQLLTANQKEVRDRQREEPAITFTDLRSSPPRRHSEPRDCGFARKAATMTARPTTPTLPDHNEATDAHPPEPSPTPKSKIIRNISEVDVPSSPRSMPDEPPSSPPKQAETNMGRSPDCSSSVLDTDELNELSASQLSHDLNWSTVREGLDVPPTASESPQPADQSNISREAAKPATAAMKAVDVSTELSEEHPAHIDEADTTLTRLPRKKRKRPVSGYAERKRKRRKPSRSQSQSTSSQVSYVKHEEEQEEELLDCIVVDTSEERGSRGTPYVLIPTVEVTAPTSDMSWDGVVERPPAHFKTDVVEGLQNILEQMKTAASATIDLKAVDELCFQIRFQAQVAAMGQEH